MIFKVDGDRSLPEPQREPASLPSRIEIYDHRSYQTTGSVILARLRTSAMRSERTHLDLAINADYC